MSSGTGSPDAASDESRPVSAPSPEGGAAPSKPPAEASAEPATPAKQPTPAKSPAESPAPAKTAAPLKPGGVVPNKASEDDPRAWGDSESDNDHDAWLKEQKPPHWG